MQTRDVYRQVSTSQALRQDANNTANNFVTGVSSNYRTYTPENSKYPTVASTRSSAFDPQKSFSNISGTGRYSSASHWYSNSSQITSAANSINRLSFLTPSASRPKIYYWSQDYTHGNPVKAVFDNQYIDGLNFYRFSNGNNVVLDQFKASDLHWLYYNNANMDNNLLTLSSAGVISKIETVTGYLDNTTNPTTPLLFQTHGGMGANDGGAMRTDYTRDSHWQADDRDTYIWYRPNFGSNVQLPTNVETEGEWSSNRTGERSGR